jgi:hypothetical protein
MTGVGGECEKIARKDRSAGRRRVKVTRLELGRAERQENLESWVQFTSQPVKPRSKTSQPHEEH